MLVGPVAPGVPAPRRRDRHLRLKYALDHILALLALVVLLPVLLVVAVLVKATSRGPVLFRQQRIGENGRGFVMLKFRTMRQPTKLLRFEPVPGMAPGGIEGEDRCTVVGRVLRAASLDELPQLVNVLRGEMSMVGPRPERPQFVERFSRELPGYAERHRVRPGITGWAQVRGFRGPTSISGRLELDRAYIQSWSLWLDIWILLLTAATVVGLLRADRPQRGDGGQAVLVGRRQETAPGEHSRQTPDGEGSEAAVEDHRSRLPIGS